MPFYAHQIFEIHSLERNEQIIDLSSFNNTSQSITQNMDSSNNIQSMSSIIPSWIISPDMQQIISKFENKILCQFPYLSPTPNKIDLVPLEKRRYLSPILHCLLGQPQINTSTILLLDNSITNAVNWRKENNLYLHSYSQMLTFDLSMHLRLPIATYLPNDENVLPIQQDEKGFRMLIFHNQEYCNTLRVINTLIIEEISMISGLLLIYISKLFEYLHQNNNPFGGINVILVVWDMLTQKFQETTQSIQINTTLNTTYVVGYRETAELINRTICASISTNKDKILISNYTDIIDRQICSDNSRCHEFTSKTNLPNTIRIQPGARYMHHFYLNGIPASRTQYPIQNAFALTIHKTQELTLPNISMNLDNQIFKSGQAYVALS
ncbi:17247_t:CDS:2 [Cetraspora pellucida]|uniref:17247_t:CDS:1 n=1 Tax=Cetraspora pellucida TaxID=1433469 RepID=A0A9N9GKG9_9GLOM|nr:17247_t:CDS:2 [Cetraspora pellucida]